MAENYTFFSFKSLFPGDPWYFRYLEKEHGLILEDYDRNFCILKKTDASTSKSDDICYGTGPLFVDPF